MNDWTILALVALLSYALGAVPFGLLLTRAAGLGDIRAIGSGNIGATNVLRTGSKRIAAATLLLDGGKGAAAVLAVRCLLGDRPDWLELVAGGAALAGHCYSIWIGFRGGKGVATFLGIAVALWWPIALVAAALWLLAVLATRYSSVGGLAAANGAPVASLLFGRMDLALFFLGAALLIDWNHRANIARLARGIEPKLGRKAAG